MSALLADSTRAKAILGLIYILKVPHRTKPEVWTILNGGNRLLGCLQTPLALAFQAGPSNQENLLQPPLSDRETRGNAWTTGFTPFSFIRLQRHFMAD